AIIPNHLGGQDAVAADGRTFAKVDPATGREICRVARSNADDVRTAVALARKAQPAWAAMTPVKRGDILRRVAILMQEHRADVAWKAFPALLCGNAAILKAAEDTPLSAWAFGVLAREAGVPDGVYSTLHGFGEEAGAPLVEHPDVAVVSFTGSCEVGRWIAE